MNIPDKIREKLSTHPATFADSIVKDNVIQSREYASLHIKEEVEVAGRKEDINKLSTDCLLQNRYSFKAHKVAQKSLFGWVFCC